MELSVYLKSEPDSMSGELAISPENGRYQGMPRNGSSGDCHVKITRLMGSLMEEVAR